MIFARELGTTLRHLLETDERVVVLGEDIADPYGGAFKVTRGLSTDFPDRVRTTPVSEAAIAGISAGLALAGMRPIAEIMFGDFLSLCFDQIVNHIAKYEAMYNHEATCPVIIRTPSGGHRGYGPTHSQSLEKHYVGIPHLRVIAASPYHDPGVVFAELMRGDDPALYIEHKLLYPERLVRPGDPALNGTLLAEESAPESLPTVRLSYVDPQHCTLTVLAYGYEALLAARVIERLALEEEIFAELLVPSQIAPLDWMPIERSVDTTGALLTVEEGTAGWSWGTEVAATVGRRLFGRLRRPVEVLASRSTVIPSSRRLEREMLVGPDQIEEAVRRLAA